MLFFKGSQIFASSNGVNLASDYSVLEKYDKTKKCVAIAFQTINHVISWVTNYSLILVQNVISHVKLQNCHGNLPYV